MSQIQLGCKVLINSFKNKNQQGFVKFIGEVKGKLGEWVGVELEEPKGDMDGTVNGVVIFDCNPNSGLLLRANQLKILAPPLEDYHKNHPQNLDIDEIDVSESPLLTPKDPPPRFQSKLQGNISQQLQQKLQEQQPETQADQQQKQGDGGKLGWKERLEKLREQKAKKQNEEPNQITKKEESKDPEQEKINQIFAPAMGIKRTNEGKIEVDKEVVKQQQKKEEEPIPAISEQKEVLQQEEIKKPVASTLASKIGGGLGKGLKGPTHSKQPSSNPVATAQTTGKTVTQASEATKELKSKNEQLKEKLAAKVSQDVTKTQVSATAKSEAPKTLGFKKPEITKELSTDKNKQDSTNLSSTTTTSKIGLKKQTTSTDKLGIQKPITAKTKEEEKKPSEIKKVPVIAAATKDKKQTKPIIKEDIPQIVEIERVDEDEQLLTDDLELDSPEKFSPPKTNSQKSLSVKSVQQQKTSPIRVVQQQSEMLSQSMTLGGVNQAEYKKLETQLRKKNDEAYSLQIEVRELSSRIQNLQDDHKVKVEEIEQEYQTKLNDLQSRLNDNSAAVKFQEIENDYQMKIKQLEAQLSDNNELIQAEQQAKLREQELLAQIEDIKKQKEDALQQIQRQQQDIQEYEKLKLKLLTDIEAKNIEIETIQLEIDLLKDEKEELINQIKMASEVQDDGLEGLTQDELREQNQKLRQAITTLSMNYEVEKSKFETKITELYETVDLVDEYEKKLEDMDLLMQDLEFKEKERLDMEKKLEECLEYEDMVEEMTSELLKKEEENEELVQKIQELQEMNVITEELNENQEQYIKELNGELSERDATISNMEATQTKLEELVLDLEEQNNKYKEKCRELKQKNKTFEEELQATYANSDQKFKISSLIEKQNQLISKLREANKKDLELNKFKIEYWQEKLKSHVIESFIPERLHDESRIDSLEKIQLLNKARNKAMLLIREICEKQILNVDQLHEDLEQRQNFIRLLIVISEEAVKLIDTSNKIMFCIDKMPIEKYVEATTKILAWNKYITLSQFMDKILELLKEESLSTKFDISIFVQSVKSLQDLQASIEFKYLEKTEQEKENDKEDVAYHERQQSLKQFSKYKLRNEILKMALGVIVLASIAGYQNEDMKSKCKFIYQRLLDILLKIDYIEGQGEEFLNIEELSIDTRLAQKFETLKILWTGMDEAGDSQEKDWTSVLEAIEKDVTALVNDFKFKQLINKYEKDYKEPNIDDLYKYGWNSKGPWTLAADHIRQDFEDAAGMKEKIEQLQEKQKEQTKVYLLLKREKEEILVVNQSLEKRLSDAMARGEKLSALEIEKKSFMEKEQYLNQQIEQAKKEIELIRQREKELRDKLVEAEQISQSPSKGSAKKKSILTGRASNTTSFFSKLQQTNLNQRKDTLPSMTRQSSVSNAEVQRHLQQNEEAFTSIIIELQQDRMRMKGRNMMERLNKLQRTQGALNEYILKQREKKDIQLKLSKEEQGTLENALTNVESLKNKVKKEMANSQIIDLRTSKNRVEIFSTVQPELQKNEKINYLLVKVKEEVNNVAKIVFPKDSNFHALSTPKQVSDINNEKNENLIKIGAFKLKGLIPNLTEKKTLLINDQTSKELRRNLTVFAN